MIIDDLIILGTAVPDLISNGRVTVCLGGYSHKHGFVRIYPTHPKTGIERWSIVKIPVERNERDNRKESWKIEGSKSEWHNLPKKMEIVGKLPKNKRLELVANLEDDCVKVIYNSGRSLGIVKPEIIKTYFGKRDNHEDLIQKTLLGDSFLTIKNYESQPRMTYKCLKCQQQVHDQQILEWGIYEWMRKNPNKLNQVWENLLLQDESHEIYLLVGNQAIPTRRNAYMIISILRLPKGTFTQPIMPLNK